MKYEDIKPYRRNEYKRMCEGCHSTLTALTQRDDYPEYYTDVYIKCPNCTEHYILFELPVN